MTRYIAHVLALHAFIVGAALIILLTMDDASAAGVVGFTTSITELPETREDDSPLDKSEIEAFRVFRVGETGLEALTPDIEYDNESDTATGVVYMTSDVAQGVADLCAMTIDTFNQISTVCSDVISVPFDIPPPSAPGGFTVTQSVTLNVTITTN